MASLPLESVDIFDDFEDADIMQSSYCKLVLEDQYYEDMRSETDKALGELCLYLDQNPEVYSRVLRKRKQEEMENAGMFSYVKSKMMSLLHGEQYPHCLVNASECVQKTNALKSGMCKTFQLSEELNGSETRHSARLAAKRQAKMSYNKNGDGQISKKKAEDKSVTKSITSDKSEPLESSAMKDGLSRSIVDQPASPHILDKDNPSQSTVPVVSVETASGDVSSKESSRCVISKIGVENVTKGKTATANTDVTPSQPADLEVTSSVTIPSPPPAPPLPAFLINSSLPKQSTQETQLTRNSIRNNKPHTPGKVKSEQRSSPRVHARKVERVPSRANSLQNLSRLSQSDLSNVSSPFLTPELPTRLRTHKRSQSNSSVSSISSCGSYSSVHSEIISSNPIKRLKATHIIRSPGGTPARQTLNVPHSEPFHRALYAALKTRFKNVNTPSPRSGNTSASVSNNSMLNATFSP